MLTKYWVVKWQEELSLTNMKKLWRVVLVICANRIEEWIRIRVKVGVASIEENMSQSFHKVVWPCDE